MKTLDENFKGAVVSVMDELLYLNKMNRKNYSFRVLNEYLFTSQACWAFPKNSYLVAAFDEKLSFLTDSGLINHLSSKYMDPKYLHVRKIKQGPRNINLNQLFGAFEVLFGGLLIATLFFLNEIWFTDVKKIIARFFKNKK